MKQFLLSIKRQRGPPLIVVGFALVILLGTGLLLLPISVRDDATVSFIDALFTSTSAVCVTGLIAIATWRTTSPCSARRWWRPSSRWAAWGSPPSAWA